MAIPEKGKYLMNKKFPKILTRGLYKSEKDGKELKQKNAIQGTASFLSGRI